MPFTIWWSTFLLLLLNVAPENLLSTLHTRSDFSRNREQGSLQAGIVVPTGRRGPDQPSQTCAAPAVDSNGATQLPGQGVGTCSQGRALV